MLIPVCFLGVIHLQWILADLQPIFSDLNQELTFGILFLVLLLILTIVHWYMQSILRKASKEFGLGLKLDNYFKAIIIRYAMNVVCCFIVIAVYMLTQFELLNAFFFLPLLWMMIQFPTSKKVCKELKLKGDEKEMVLYKKDKF